ncbi:hypothetical protein BaRGS_00028165, partial [Batillaria attramentaria]
MCERSHVSPRRWQSSAKPGFSNFRSMENVGRGVDTTHLEVGGGENGRHAKSSGLLRQSNVYRSDVANSSWHNSPHGKLSVHRATNTNRQYGGRPFRETPMPWPAWSRLELGRSTQDKRQEDGTFVGALHRRSADFKPMAACLRAVEVYETCVHKDRSLVSGLQTNLSSPSLQTLPQAPNPSIAPTLSRSSPSFRCDALDMFTGVSSIPPRVVLP